MLTTLRVLVWTSPTPTGIVPLIYQIKDKNRLKAVKSAAVTAKTADEWIEIIKSLP
jgi:hypothetical protein